MRSNSELHEPRTNAEQSETGADVRVSDESEEWRAVPIERIAGLYEVSNLGRVRSLHVRWRTPKVLTPTADQFGYPDVNLSRHGKSRRTAVHRLVALAFHGDKRNILHREVAHIDGTRTNNRADNLKWVSHAENMAHKRIHGTSGVGELHHRAKLTESDAREIVALLASDMTASKIARRFGVSDGAIADIRTGRNWRHIPKPDGFKRPRSSGNGQRGEDNHQAKLTAQQALKIRSMRGLETCVVLGKRFGISKATVSRIWRSETYANPGLCLWGRG